ncbi:MerR family transcriptional regulator [Synergistaceae bacterium OttesenSCG-928-D05]|nr:MerR family transcriptional regulator [Synergistaceae bacterium OttesenSCG-928-D05]
MYTVKQAAEITGISAHTLRFYDKKGLFPDLSRDHLNRRVFSDADLRYVRSVQKLRNMGMPLAEIATYMKASDENRALQQKYELIEKQKARALEQLKSVQMQLELLETESRTFEKALHQEIPSGLWNLEFSVLDGEEAAVPTQNGEREKAVA